MTDSLNQAAFFAALSVHMNAHPDLHALASVTEGWTLQIPGDAGITAAITWAHTLGGDNTVKLRPHSNGEIGVHISGTVAGHAVTVFTVDNDRLHELLPPDVGQPYFERTRTVTLAELESHLTSATADAPVSKQIPAWRGTWPTATTEFDQQLATALDLFPAPVTAAILASDAFGALAYKVNRRCQETSETPEQVLNSVSDNDVAFLASADDPAAFLASRIESCPEP